MYYMSNNKLILFQERERINNIVMEYQRKKAVSIKKYLMS